MSRRAIIRLLVTAAALVTLVLPLSMASPAGATPRALYVGDGIAGAPGELWQFSLRAGGLPIALPSPSVVAGQETGAVSQYG